MIKRVQIKNFKSVVNLPLDLGNFNVLIGENGSGKSNILEAIAFGAAASADKLDFEFLGSRGIRVTNAEFMSSAFPEIKGKQIQIDFSTNEQLFSEIKFLISVDPENNKKWINEIKETIDKKFGDEIANLLFIEDPKARRVELLKHVKVEKLIPSMEKFADGIIELTKKDGLEDKKMDFFKFIFNNYFLKDKYYNERVSNFIIFSPEESSLRRFEDTAQIYPLGIRGEGLFQYIKELSQSKKGKKILSSIKENLELIDWYENFELPDKMMKSEFSLKIKDRYLRDNSDYFDQRSTNEGFLFLLFYSALLISPITPKFFAIDNIDASFNPKLCIRITENLAALAKKHKKQLIVTTQNPAILDGLNLKDENQRLFVISRNSEGYTRAERINYNSKRNMALSEVWVKGYIGGLPSNF